MLLTLAAVFAILWLLGFTAFHVTTGAIHILLAMALIAVAVQFFQSRKRTV